MPRISLVISFTLLLAASSLQQQQGQSLDTCLGKVKAMYQGNCIADYAVVVTTAVELAWCRIGSQYDNVRLSAQHLICNCKQCHLEEGGNGCLGGDLAQALNFVTGGGNMVGGGYPGQDLSNRDFGADGPRNYSDCLQYWSAPCDPSEESCNYEPYDLSRINPLAPNTYCPTECNRIPNAAQKNKVAESSVGRVLEIERQAYGYQNMKERIDAGLILVSTMEIYEDMEFYFGKPEIYRHSTGQSLGHAAVIIVGVTPEAVPTPAYWTVIVPWDRKYSEGLKGQTIRVYAGVNQGGIESISYALKAMYEPEKKSL